MLNIVIPMAWAGSRFAQAWYTFPKPLIEVKGKPMIQVVVDNLRPKNRSDYRFTFLVNKEHYAKYALKDFLSLIAPGCHVVVVEDITKWAACTVLLAAEYLENEDELIIANSDQFIENSIDDFLEFASKEPIDGVIMSFKATHPKWSFAKVGNDGYVEEVAEKRPISDTATVGIYYYRIGNDFVTWVKNMIKKNITTNGEFYICPVYNELILSDKKIKTYDIGKRMHGLGTPEDLNRFIDSEISNEI